MIKLIPFSLLIILVSCSSNEPEPIPDAEALVATSIMASDVSDFDNPKDISVTFTAAAVDEFITEYRVFYAQADNTVDINSAQKVSSSAFKSLQNGNETYTSSLNEDQLSFDGSTFKVGEQYKAYVLSLTKDENGIALSEPSNEFSVFNTSVLDSSSYSAQISSVIDKGNNGNASDIIVSFEKAAANSFIDEYRIVIANSETNNIALSTLIEIPEGSYTKVESDQGANNVSLLESQLDYNGNSVESGNSYQVYILSIGEFNQEKVYIISEPSEKIDFTINPEVSTLLNSGANDGVAVDLQGNIYIANYGDYNTTTNTGTGNNLVKVTPEGQVSEYVSNLIGPVGTAISEAGILYVNSGSNFITGDLIKVDSNGSSSTLATLRGYPSGILIGKDNNLFVSNYWLPIIHEVTLEGDSSVFASDSRLKGAVGIAYDNSDNIIVGNLDTGEILSVDINGVVSLIATIPPTVGYITFFEDHVYATASTSQIIYKISLSGEMVKFAGNGSQATRDGEFQDASFDRPNGIAIDKVNRLLYVSQIGGSLRVIPLE